ncbi:PREDICTED: traB domain-containing protein-like [Ceratosolen solmsi marchali]|uniref:TraB domain-containing protein-like n=1 Tax=Ceratosolen solmsi marchali TaxID=326594 RepID=A0AAJ6VNG1_9HYME|nr:PREDICTED: traB domain-containing protein-like [Ceratosolen solmsi marchali]
MYLDPVELDSKIKYNGIRLETRILNHESDLEPFMEENTAKQSNINDIDDNLPSTVTLLRTPDGGKCYVVGTAHFSIESQNDVSRIIQAVQPHIITVELCMDRIDILKLDEERVLREAKNLSFNDIIYIIKENGMNKGLLFILSFKLIAYLTKILDLAPGGEYRRALIEAKKIPNCLIHMGDRPIKITFARACGYLTLWQKIKLAWQLLTQNISISREDLEKYKNRNVVEEIIVDLAKEYPVLEEVFIKERDIYLTYSLQLACKPKIGKRGELIPAKVVGIIGIGHMLGIVQNWGKVKKCQIPLIMR